jgi:hypothetical protein
VRRVFFATTLAGMAVASCGGRVSGEKSGGPEVASEAEIAGGCGALDGSAPSCGYSTDSCQCGVAGSCENGACVPKSCDPGTYLDSAGECDSVYWFTPGTSYQTCYGCPPPLLA